MAELSEKQKRALDLAQEIMNLIAQRLGRRHPSGGVFDLGEDAGVAFNALANAVSHLLDGYPAAVRARAVATFVDSITSPQTRIVVGPDPTARH